MSRPNPIAPVRRPLPWLAAVAVVVLATLPATAGEIYQWKDARGVTHYSDSPPANRAYTNRTVNNRAATPVAGAQPAAAVENDRCITARDNLVQLQGEAPVGIDADGDGKPDTVMNPEQRAAQTQLAQAALRVHCAGTGEATPAG